MAQAPDENHEPDPEEKFQLDCVRGIDAPCWFQYQIIHGDEVDWRDVKAKKNKERLKREWEFFKRIADIQKVEESASVLTKMEKVLDLYKHGKFAKLPEAKIHRALMELANYMVERVNVDGDQFDGFRRARAAGWELNGHLVSLEALKKELKPVRATILKMIKENNVWQRMKLIIIEPLDAVVPDTPLEKLPQKVVESAGVKNTVDAYASYTPYSLASKAKPAVKEAACKALDEYNEPTGLQKMFSKCNVLSKKSVLKKAHRDQLNMYMFGDYASDEYGSDDILDLNAYDVDLQPPQNQVVPPFYHPNQYQVQPQPVVIAGYDAGNAMSMDTSMAFATLFGVGLLSFLLCLLFVILVCAATAFGVYASSQRSKPSPYRDEEEHELVSAV